MEGEDSSGYENTGLGIASRNEHINVVKYLLSIPDVRVAATNKYGYNALHLAAWKNKKGLDTIHLLLSHESCTRKVLHAIAHIGYTPLDLVKKYNKNNNLKKQIIEVLESNGAKCNEEVKIFKKKVEMVNLRYKEEYPNIEISPFIIACQKGRLEDVQMYVESEQTNDINMTGKSDDGRFYTGLGVAVRYEQIDVVTYLLSLDNINLGVIGDDSDGYNALHYGVLCKKPNLELINLLLNHKSCTNDVLNTETRLGDTLLSIVGGDGRNRFKYLNGNDNVSDIQEEVIALLQSKVGNTVS